MAKIGIERHDLESGEVLKILISENSHVDYFGDDLKVKAALALLDTSDPNRFFEWGKDELYYDLCDALKSAVEHFEN
ncbi:hypothetical protein [Companilactobacillus jidongensis]|uniref:hypothetical protein n=1 Tax=Companilactobacillus jidongensis TaxID=2486006 RepID=UPI000F77839A|nr:hypothetical protein [Companilactobacillus jidongensis]